MRWSWEGVWEGMEEDWIILTKIALDKTNSSGPLQQGAALHSDFLHSWWTGGEEFKGYNIETCKGEGHTNYMMWSILFTCFEISRSPYAILRILIKWLSQESWIIELFSCTSISIWYICTSFRCTVNIDSNIHHWSECSEHENPSKPQNSDSLFLGEELEAQRPR